MTVVQQHPLTTYRKRTGQSLEALARRVGTTKSWLSRIENGLEMPSAALMERIMAESQGDISANDFFNQSNSVEVSP